MKRLALLLSAAIAVLLYWVWARSFPIVFAWDQDLIHAVDTFLLRSNELPDHVNHPGFGTYLIWKFTHGLAHLTGWVEAWDLNALSTSLNPVLISFELTDFLRAHSPLLVSVMALVCVCFFNPTSNAWIGVALLAQAGFAYHATLTRTETTSAFFWLAAMAVGLRWQSPARYYFSGLLFALAFFTKIQVLILILFGVTWIIVKNGVEWRGSLIPSSHLLRKRIEASALFLITLGTLILAARFELPEPPFATFASEYRWNSAATLWLLGSALPLVFVLRGRTFTALSQMLWGALGVGVLHLVMMGELSQSLSYLGVNLKMVFFRTNYQSLHGIGLIKMVSRLAECVMQSPLLWLIHFLVLGAFVTRLVRERAPASQLVRKLFPWLAIEGLLLVHIMLGTRPILRDWIWFELPLLIWTVALITELKLSPKLLAPVGATLLLAQALSVYRIQALTLDSYREYGYQSTRWMDRVYPGRGDRYGQILAAHHPHSERLLAQAGRLNEIKRDLRLTFPNTRVTLRQVGLSPLSASGQALQFERFHWIKLDASAPVVSAAWSDRDLALQADPPHSGQEGVSKGLVTLRGRSDIEVITAYKRERSAPPKPERLPEHSVTGMESPRLAHGLYALPDAPELPFRFYRLERGVNLAPDAVPDWVLIKRRLD